MKLGDLLDNPEFSFNCMYRIVKFAPTEENSEHVIVLYESGSRKPLPKEFMDLDIGGINQNLSTGIIDLECF